VLFVNENFGGHATMHLHLRRALAEHPEIDARFLDVPPAGLLRKAAGHPVPMLASRDLDLQMLRAQLATSTWVHRRLRRLVPTVDAVHVYTQNAVLLSPSLLRTVPTVVSTDATTEQWAYLTPERRPTRHTRTRVRWSRRFEDRVFDAARVVVAKSAWTRDSLRTAYGIPDERLRVIPFGLTVPPLERDTRTGPPIVTFVGYTMDRKGGWRLLDAFRRHLSHRCELHLVTRADVAPEPGVHVHGDFVPGDERLRSLLARTSVFAFPTEIDTFGYAVLEAMAAGVPVVATGVHALPEIVEHGVTGLLVGGIEGTWPEGSVDPLAVALDELLADPERARRMGEAGRRRVLERFDARVTTATLCSLLAEVTGGEDARRQLAPSPG
jgi:glycosyltransferase involved in cell wall biosynthesis